MIRPLRFGILGCARICRRAMIEAICASGVATLEAIASRDGATAAAWAAEFNIPKHYGDYQAIVDDPDIDAVYIPLPNELHLPWVLAAAARGKHVLCEKPLALGAAEADEMVAACQSAGVILMEAFMWRHHPRVTLARRLLAEGQLGALRLIKLDFSFPIDPGDWRLDPERGGGALFDLGCYGVNIARLFAGAEPTEVVARSQFHPRGVDMTDGFLLRFPDDVLAVMDCSFDCVYRNRIEIVGTRGALELPDGVLPPPGSPLLLRTAEGVQSIDVGTANVSAALQYTEQVKAFCQGVRDGRLPDPAEGGSANIRVLDAVLSAARAASNPPIHARTH